MSVFFNFPLCDEEFSSFESCVSFFVGKWDFLFDV